MERVNRAMLNSEDFYSIIDNFLFLVFSSLFFANFFNFHYFFRYWLSVSFKRIVWWLVFLCDLHTNPSVNNSVSRLLNQVGHDRNPPSNTNLQWHRPNYCQQAIYFQLGDVGCFLFDDHFWRLSGIARQSSLFSVVSFLLLHPDLIG